MKKLLIFLIAIIFSSCFTTKEVKKVHTLKSVFTLSGKDSTLELTIEDHHGKVIIESAEPRDLGENRGEGIGLGSVGTIGHGASGFGSGHGRLGDSHNSEGDAPEGIKIVEIKNTKVIKESSELSEGRVVYKIPETMKVRTTYQVVLRIAKSRATLSVYDSLKDKVITSVIPVTPVMEVKLIDASPEDHKAFEIKEDNSARQIIEDGDTYTQWSWNVTPVRAGTSKLDIVISVVRDGEKKEVVYTDTVIVKVDFFAQIIFFIRTYWQWIVGAIASCVAWIWGIRKKKKKTAKKK